MRIGALLLLLTACTAAPPAAAPPALTPQQDEVMVPVRRLFDGMRAGDSTVVRSVFHPQATLASVSVRDGQTVLRMDPVDGFVRAVGTPHAEVWDEKIWDPIVHVDGDLATAWVPYAFYAGDTFSHCGVDAFELFRGPQGWQVIHLADTRRQDGCDVPPHAR